MRLAVFTLLLSLAAVSLTTRGQEKIPYFPTGNEANVAGTIKIKGALPKPKLIDMTADPQCQDLNRKPLTESVIANQGRLANVFIYVKGDPLNAYSFPMPDSEVILNQRACSFEPHVFGLRVGQPLRIINSDPTVHNVHPTPKLNQEWNFSQAPYAPPMVKTFPRAEVMIPIKCNQHPWMKAYAGVMNHPYFAVSDKSGKFEIRGLPAGTYKVVAWHELFGEQEMDVTLAPGENRTVDFTVDGDLIPGRMHP